MSTPSKTKLLAVIVSALIVSDQTWSQRFVELPSLYVSVVSGIISLATSALNVTLSVSASPSVILPSALILPVACISPFTCKFENTSTCPVPFGRSSKFAFESFVLITLSNIEIL